MCGPPAPTSTSTSITLAGSGTVAGGAHFVLFTNHKPRRLGRAHRVTTSPAAAADKVIKIRPRRRPGEVARIVLRPASMRLRAGAERRPVRNAFTRIVKQAGGGETATVSGELYRNDPTGSSGLSGRATPPGCAASPSASDQTPAAGKPGVRFLSLPGGRTGGCGRRWRTGGGSTARWCGPRPACGGSGRSQTTATAGSPPAPAG